VLSLPVQEERSTQALKKFLEQGLLQADEMFGTEMHDFSLHSLFLYCRLCLPETTTTRRMPWVATSPIWTGTRKTLTEGEEKMNCQGETRRIF
jgi:hypothetical protein